MVGRICSRAAQRCSRVASENPRPLYCGCGGNGRRFTELSSPGTTRTPRRTVLTDTGATAPSPVIEIDHVTKRFADYIAVDDADFSVGAGEFFSMLGPSGCGKTTTLRMIAGFDTPTEGAIRLGGVDVSRVSPNKRNVNTVFQHYALFPHMTVWDNVAYGPRSRKKNKERVKKDVDEMIEVVRLTDFALRKPAQLSGGQQQRVALARALVNYPSALLLDEPLGALDLKLRHVMQFELKRIQRELGITFVYVTHDQEEALTMSDRIAVMNVGKVEQIGTPAEIYDRPATVFVAGFIGQANLWQGRQTGRVNRDHVEIDVLGTTLRARPGEGSAAIGDPAISGSATGSPATLMVRPERVRVSVGLPAADLAAVRATVVDLTFQGPLLRLELAAADGSPVVAHVGPEQDLPMLRPGDDVHVGWSPDAALVLAAAATPLPSTGS